MGRFWTYTEVEHAQGLDITSLYPANTGSGGSWVRCKRGHGLAMGRGENLFWVSAQALLGEMSCWDDIPPKSSKDELKPLGACHEG